MSDLQGHWACHVIASGKGGTGKTTIAVPLPRIAFHVLPDCM